jgi:hypothetical protein
VRVDSFAVIGRLGWGNETEDMSAFVEIILLQINPGLVLCGFALGLQRFSGVF